MVSAFQPLAFQASPAFQIDSTVDTHDGHGGGHYRRKDKTIGNLIMVYDRVAKNIPESEQVLSVVEPFVSPINSDEMEKRYKAHQIISVLPNSSRVDFDSLAENELAVELLKIKLMSIMDLLEQRENEEFELLTLIACTL
jgi:hypothetical protein